MYLNIYEPVDLRSTASYIYISYVLTVLLLQSLKIMKKKKFFLQMTAVALAVVEAMLAYWCFSDKASNWVILAFLSLLAVACKRAM